MANAEKVAAVAELTGRFKDSSGAVLTEYRGLTVAQLAELRRSLGHHATFAVVKNTLTKIAVNEAGLDEQLSSLLVGPSAIASEALRYSRKESRSAGRRTLPTFSRKAGTEGESFTAPKSSTRARSAPSSSSRRLGKRSSNTRFRKA